MQEERIFKVQQDINERLNIVMEEYYFQINQTEKYWDRDSRMALKIQSVYKMYKLMQLYARKRKVAITFQKHFRAYLARKRFQHKKEEQINKRNIQYFSQQAVIIQRYFRGFHKRKYVHDFHSRKQFLNLLQQKNDKFLEDLYKVAQEEKIEEERRQEALARQEFNKLTSNLHHLSSTSQIPGIYNPPYSIQKPTAFNIEVETHLKAIFKANYKWQPPKLSATVGGGGLNTGKKTQGRPVSGQKLEPLNHTQKLNQTQEKNQNDENNSNFKKSSQSIKSSLANTKQSLAQN